MQNSNGFQRFILIILLFSAFTFEASAQKNTYSVFALKFAAREGKIPVTSIAVGAATKDSVEVCFMIWLLKGDNGKIILVDAGFSDTTNMHGMAYVRPDTMLTKIHIDPKDITDIIITHPHWDHIGGIDQFPRAMLWMQKEDYNYFVGTAWQHKGNAMGFNDKDVHKIVQKNMDGKLTLVNGDNLEIIPGIKVFTGSKHTYESQYVLVNSASDKVIIASDNSWYYYNLINLLPIPVTLDSKAYTKNLKRMKKMVPNTDLIIPGHDPLVFTKFLKVAEGIVKIRD